MFVNCVSGKCLLSGNIQRTYTNQLKWGNDCYVFIIKKKKKKNHLYLKGVKKTKGADVGEIPSTQFVQASSSVFSPRNRSLLMERLWE